MKRWYIIFIIVFIALGFVNYSAAGSSWQVDFSQNKIHSISPATKKILRRLKNTVTIKVFLSEKLPPQTLQLRTALISLLDRYRQLSQNKIHLEFLDPNKNNSARKEAERLGIQPIEFSAISHDQLQISRGYFAASVSCGNKEKIVPLTQILANLEYNFSAAILKVTRKKPKVIGWTSDFQTASPSQLPLAWKSLQQIGQPQLINLADLKDKNNIDALIIIGPQSKFNKIAKENLDRFLQSGRGVLLLNSEYHIASNLTATSIDNNLYDLLKHYGFQNKKGFVLDKIAATASFRSRQGQTLLTVYPFWPIIRKRNISQKYSALANLNEIVLFWPSPLKLDHGAQPLFKTGSSAWISQSQKLTPYELKPPSKTKSFIIAGYQNRVISSYYQPKEKHRVKFAVVNNSNFISSQSLYSQPQNLTLFLDLIDLVTNDSQLAQIRNKAILTAAIQPLSSRQRQTIRLFNLAVPLIFNSLLAVGYWLYQRRARKYEKQVTLRFKKN